MKRQDVKDMVQIVGATTDGAGFRVVFPDDALRIFNEYKKLKKAIKKHKKETYAAFGPQHHGIDTELWEVLNDN